MSVIMTLLSFLNISETGVQTWICVKSDILKRLRIINVHSHEYIVQFIIMGVIFV